jgi:16S rRNA (cytosine1402-N4)-methyltransferase
MTEQGSQKSGDGGHKRRKRYGGTHPKKFGEKYKERNPQKYPDIHKHLRAKGKTPAGTHVPIMVEEVIGLLKPAPGMVVADCTIGYGGHANAFMNCLTTLLIFPTLRITTTLIFNTLFIYNFPAFA